MTGSRSVEVAGRVARLGVLPALIFLSFFLFGAYLPLPSMVLTLAIAIGLTVMLSQRDLRAQLAQIRGLRVAAVLFGLVVLMALWSLTPWTPGGAHPVWAMAGIAGGASTMNVSATQMEIVRLCGLACVFLVGCLFGADTQRAYLVFKIVLAIGAVYSLIALIVFLSGGQLAYHDSRLTGGFYSANTAAGVMAILTLVNTSAVVREWRRGSGRPPVARLQALVPGLALTLLFIACLLLTSSRTVIALTSVILIVVLAAGAIGDRRARGPMALIAAAIALLVVAYLLAGNTLFVNRFVDAGADGAARATILQAHWHAFLASPLFGYGLGSYPEINNQITTPDNFLFLAQTIVLHNSYLQWLEEAGLIGALPMFLLVAWIIGISTWRTVLRRRNRTAMIGLLAASAVVLAHAAVDVSLHVFGFCAFWSLLLGMGFALSQTRERRRDRAA